MLNYSIFLWIYVFFNGFEAESRRERLEVLLETLEAKVLTVEEEILRREELKNAESSDDLSAFSRIAVDSGGLSVAELEGILAENHFQIIAKHPTLSNIFLAERIDRRTGKGREKRGPLASKWEDFQSRFDWVEPLDSLKIQKRSEKIDGIESNDPHFRRQSPQFDQMGFNRAWTRGLSGNGITIAVVDDGIKFSASPELSSANKEIVPEKIFGSEPLDEELFMHGTMCAGVIGMRANNSECGVGGAPRAKILDVPLLSRVVTDYSESVALSQKADIFTCSWGPPDDGESAEGPLRLTRTVIQLQANKGRNGLGSLFVWASGNGGNRGDDCALDGFVSNQNTIAIGWTVWNKTKTEWSEGCPAILTSVISDQFGGQVSVNGKGLCVPTFRGTSAAAPLVASGLALVLEKFPQLSRREINHLIVYGSDSSYFTKLGSEKWQNNAGGLRFNRFLGFGLFSVERMLNLAPKLKNPFPKVQECSEGYNTAKNQGLAKDVSAQLPFNDCENIKFLENLQLSIRLTHQRRGDLSIRLKSPSGTEVILLDQRPNDRSKNLDWTFTVNHFWSENPNGNWVIQISDKGKFGGKIGVESLSLTVRGTMESPFSITNIKDIEEIAQKASKIGSSSSSSFSMNLLLFCLFFVLISLIIYGGLEYLSIRRKSRRTESSWRLLNDQDQGDKEGNTQDNHHFLVNEAFLGDVN